MKTKRIERCVKCDEPTGKAGRLDDSLYDDDGNGPFCETCFHERTGPMKTAREIAARIWCDLEMSKVAMDVDAAEAIAKIIYDVRRNQADAQSYTDLAASGGIVDAP